MVVGKAFCNKVNAFVATLLCVAALPLFAMEPVALPLTLQGNDVVVTVPANTLYDTSRLYLVWDGVDCGSELSAWPAGNRIQYDGTLTTAGGTITFDGSGIPSGSIVRAIATSDVRLIGSWVKLAANQYIDTGILDTAAYGVRFKYRYYGEMTGGNYASLMGAVRDNFTIGKYGDHLYLRWHNGTAYNTTAFPNGSKSYDVHEAYIYGGTVYWDGTATQTGIDTGATGNKGKTIVLGGTRRNSGAYDITSYLHAEWHYAQILDSAGKPMVNLVPALRGDTASPTAFFYDSLSGDFFDNAGTGGALAYDTSASVTNTITYLSAISDTLTTGVTAWWTGNGNRANVNDPANWACTNAAGAEVAVAYPDIYTVVKVVGASNFNVPAGQSLSFNILRFENCSLSADCDWSGLAASTQRISTASVVEYLDAPKGAYIDTGFKPNNKTSVIADVTVTEYSKSEYWFGAWNTNYKTGAFAVCNDGSSLYSGYGNDGGGSQPKLAAGRHLIHFTNGVVNVDGAMHTDRSVGGTFQVNHNLYIFGQNRSGTQFVTGTSAKQRIHSFKIYDDGVLVRDYVPVVMKGSEYCFYDRASGKLARNCGTGTFSGGAVTGESHDSVSVSVPLDFSIDLAGHNLTLADVSGNGTISDTVGGGELHVNVESGKTLENTGIALAGQLKLVKDGAGTFIASVKSQSYTGGTLITNGVLKAGVSGGYGNTSLGAVGSEVVVKGAGAAFDTNGQSGWTKYAFVLDGGTLRTSGTDYSDGTAMFRYVRLEDNSTFDLQKNFGFVGDDYAATTLDLGGHTLTVNYANSRTFYADNLTIKNGSVNLVNGGWFVVNHGELVATNVDFTVRAAFNLSSPMSVRNYTSYYNYAGANTGAVDFNVYGTFTPETDYFYGCTMRDGSRIDLSGKSGAWSSTAAFTTAGRKTVRFADDANVTIYVGARATAIGDQLVSWSELPDASVTFTLAYDGADREQALAVKTNGLFVVSSATPAYATWEVEAETPGWKFYDMSGNVIAGWEGGVTADMQVRFASYEEYVAIAAHGVTPSAFVLTGGFTLPSGAGTADMTTGFNWDFAEGVTIDLNGRTAVLPDAVMYGTKTLTVTSSVDGAQLMIDVASGVTNTIANISLVGGLSLVKNGAGTLVAAKTGQTYTGGTFVNGGWLKSTVPTTSCGAAESLITVADGAGYDWAGTISATSTMYSFDIAGTGPGGAGALRISTLSGGYTSYCLKDLTLSDDALVVDMSGGTRNDYCGFIQGPPHVLTMNGHTLTIDAGAKFNFRGVTAPDEGTIVFMTTQTGTGGNRMASFWGLDNIMSNVTFDIASNIVLNADSSKNHAFGTFIDRGIASASGNSPIRALDRFQPMTTNLVKTVTLGDATHLSPILDLSALDAPFMLGSAALTAAEGATVYVKLSDRRVKKSVPLITWTTKPANIDNITFASYDRCGKIKVMDDGVYLVSGLAIIVR